jgi:hypothetical protein
VRGDRSSELYRKARENRDDLSSRVDGSYQLGDLGDHEIRVRSAIIATAVLGKLL